MTIMCLSLDGVEGQRDRRGRVVGKGGGDRDFDPSVDTFAY